MSYGQGLGVNPTANNRRAYCSSQTVHHDFLRPFSYTESSSLLLVCIPLFYFSAEDRTQGPVCGRSTATAVRTTLFSFCNVVPPGRPFYLRINTSPLSSQWASCSYDYHSAAYPEVDWILVHTKQAGLWAMFHTS